MGGKTSTASKDKWNKSAYDSVTIRMKKGEKEPIAYFAEKQGKSLNAFIVEAIKEKIKVEDKTVLTLSKMQKILSEKDREKQKQMIDELPEEDKERLLSEAAKLAEDGKRLVEAYGRN